MAEPSTRKVQDALYALFDTIPNLTVLVDQSDEEPVPAAERPALLIRIPSVQIEPAPDGNWNYLLRALIHLECLSNNTAGETIDQTNQQTITDIMAAIGTDPTLGGRLQSIEPTAISGSEQDGADVGSAIFELEAVWFCPRYDLSTIVGHTGVHY